ncbi:MAG: hypothetical protein KKD18_03295, partial [Nanoarchaeota archaeon]|nr:hypothetical protein [Nanoarchaeota archaeon]
NNNYYIKDALILHKKDNFDLAYILTILNSKLISYYYKEKYLVLSVAKNAFLELPIKIISVTEQKPFIEKADLMLKLNKEFYEKKDKFLKLIKHEYKLNKLSTKLDKFHELDFDEFVKQLKIKLNFTKKEELMEYFEKNKKEVKELAEKIEKTDEEINEMVYKLYGITDKEKSIIEDY